MPRPVAYFNAASAGLMAPGVVDTIAAHLALEAKRGAPWAMADAAPHLDAVRLRAARLLGVAPEALAFGEQTSRLWTLAFLSLPMKAGQRILVAPNEWEGNHANIERRALNLGLEIVEMPVDTHGLIDVAATRNLIDERTAAICLSSVASTSGLVQPTEAIGQLSRPESCLYFVDAAQTIGQFPVTLHSANADVLVAPARKWLRGGRGQAMMALSTKALRFLEPVIVDPLMGDAHDARRFETWEYSVAGRLGFGAALEHLERVGLSTARQSIAAKLAALRSAFEELRHFTLLEPTQLDAAFFTISHRALSAADIEKRAAARGIAIKTVDWDLNRLGGQYLRREPTTRLSPHAYTSEQDLIELIDFLHTVA
jgi:cysteine desulfurase / selenocysteine lyase